MLQPIALEVVVVCAATVFPAINEFDCDVSSRGVFRVGPGP